MLRTGKPETIISAFQDLLDKTPPDLAHLRPSSDAWTLTEIVGHLVDSASNNHQRFARLRLEDLENFPGYDAESWVYAQSYDTCDFKALSTLWTSYNMLLLHLATTTPQDVLKNVWTHQGEPQTLEFLIADYYSHLLLHIEHYSDRLAEVLSKNNRD